MSASLTLLALCSSIGCADVVESEEQEATADPAALAVKDPIAAARGLPAAIGVVGATADIYKNGDAFTPLCTGVLIGPQTILTNLESYWCYPNDEYPLGFGLGANGKAPRRTIEIIGGEDVPKSAERRTGEHETHLSLAVLYLKDPMTEVNRIGLGTVTAGNVGKEYVDLGYHNELAEGTDVLDVRREARAVKLLRVSGPIYPGIFNGSYRDFEAWWLAYRDISRDLMLEEFPTMLRPYFRGTGPEPIGGELSLLDEGYQILTQKSHARESYGELATNDMLLKRSSVGAYRLYGVATAIPAVPKGYQIYETFGPDTLSFLEQARSWTDPCATREAGGYCDGVTVRFCGSDHKTQKSRHCPTSSDLPTCVMSEGQPVCR